MCSLSLVLADLVLDLQDLLMQAYGGLICKKIIKVSNLAACGWLSELAPDHLRAVVLVGEQGDAGDMSGQS
jgi:hypothetical protein